LAGNVSKIGVHACNHKSEKTLEWLSPKTMGSNPCQGVRR
jgi:hypothetical protein